MQATQTARPVTHATSRQGSALPAASAAQATLTARPARSATAVAPACRDPLVAARVTRTARRARPAIPTPGPAVVVARAVASPRAARAAATAIAAPCPTGHRACAATPSPASDGAARGGEAHAGHQWWPHSPHAPSSERKCRTASRDCGAGAAIAGASPFRWRGSITTAASSWPCRSPSRASIRPPAPARDFYEPREKVEVHPLPDVAEGAPGVPAHRHRQALPRAAPAA